MTQHPFAAWYFRVCLCCEDRIVDIASPTMYTLPVGTWEKGHAQVWYCVRYPPPPCISYALVQATVGVGTVIIVYVILITYEM